MLKILHNKNLLCILTGILPLFLYLNTINHDYAVDDIVLIRDNPVINQGFSNLTNILTKSTFYGYYNQNYGAYRPFTMLSFALEVQLFGLNPFISHLINILLFTITCFLLFKFLIRLFGEKYIIPVFIAVLLFIVHPIHVEVVANIKSRDEIFAFLLGFLIPMYLISKFLNINKVKYLVFATLSYLLGVLSKENAIFFFPVFILSFFILSEKKFSEIIKYTLPFFLIVILFLLLRVILLDRIPVGEISATNTLKHTSGFYETVCTFSLVLLTNIKLLIFPTHLSWDYSYPEINVTNNILFPILLIAIYGAIILYFLKKTYRKDKVAIFGILFIFALIPYSHILIGLAVNTADRFLYAPSFIICSLPIIIYNYCTAKKMNSQLMLTLISIFIIIVLSFETLKQNKIWKDTFTVYKAGIENADNSYYTHYSYGTLLSDIADKSANLNVKQNHYYKSSYEFFKSVRLFPENIDAWYMAGRCSQLSGHNAEAINAYSYTIQNFKPLKIEALFNLGLLYQKESKFDSALFYFNKVAEIDSFFNNVLNSIGEIKLYRKDMVSALHCFEKSLITDSNNYSTYNNIGIVYFEQKIYNQSLMYFLKSTEKNPSFCDGFKNAAISYNMLKMYVEALDYFNKAYNCQPDTGLSKTIKIIEDFIKK